MRAKSSKSRGNWATKGLEHGDVLDPTTQAMLLRQLYLAHFAEGHFGRAYELATQALELDVLPDVLHQDAARAKQGLGDVEGAIEHLRLAARNGPPHRRAFHAWTLGSVLLVAGRYEEAIAALQRAARWGTRDKPLYRGHLALAKCRAGHSVRNVRGLIDNLARCPAGNGYGRFVLGQLAFEAGDHRAARDYLEAFVTRTEQGQGAMTVALAGELEMAKQTLAKLA